MEDGAEEIELRPSSVLRTSTLRSNAARQVVNFMPSRQAGCNTVRLRRSNSSHRALLDMCEETDVPDATDKQADYIVRGMEQHQQLMEDNPLSEELRREALRDLPQGLTMKRNVRAKLSASVSLRSKHRPISMFKRMRYRLSFTWKRMREHFRDFIFSIELWYEAIRTIEGHLGSSVGAYFHLLRWLFCLNLLLSIFVISFIVVPQALYDNASNRTTELSALDFITGQGGLTDSLLFYGHYHNGSVVSVEPLSYYMPHAYFFAMITLYITCFVVLCYKSAYSYRRHFITPHGSGSVGQLLSSKLFCGWDFGVSSPAAAALSSAALYHDFKEILSEQNSKRSVESWYVKVLYRVVKVLIMVLVMGFIGGVQYALWLMMDSAGWTERLEPVTSLVITAVVVICPVIFNLVVKLEHYSCRTSLYVCLVRTCVLHVSTTLLLMLYWTRGDRECWETRVGQESYRLIILDAFVSLILLPLVEVVRGLMYKCQLTAAPQFDISSNSVSLMYNQCVLWFGLVFSPLLVVSVTVKYLLLFYIKKETALRTCYTGRKMFRAAQTQTVLVSLVSVSLFGSLFSLGSLFLTRESRCGALVGYNPVSSLLGTVLGLDRYPALRNILTFVTRPGCLAFLLLALCACVYIMRAKSLARASSAEVLRRLRRLHAKDKEFLLKAIQKVADGEWLYSPKSECVEDSHTWRYLHEVRKPSNAGYHFDASRLSHSFADRPRSLHDNRPSSYHTERRNSNDGDTDSSFSWQGSSSYLNKDKNKI